MRSFRKQFVAVGAAVLLLAGCAGAGTKTGQVVDDAAITTKVKASFAKDKDVSATSVSVNTDKGVVRLTGDVKSSAEKMKAERLARDIEGVRAVTNDLTVRAN
jgi:hyperosmotically inducible periplasmic protein